mmetsp:Transcript_2778/g.8168  ORF Transcript_2778/g.8168 Transcript_2778/m.8168 type:complete len:366 (+) Transcript_2778:122-1219(+)|eukprot:CAMPEP_0197725348 /NCGR_PEP_ID=MMETSP1434-20131217/6920_1 /TAXON_ID=265543 /ORGANISM="Minutocellus polymorphus, Strain CCMP3303" /LENGTH=365 /DNA_ID=CAMNT_0043310807 /DNA_START=61 /DNA_END=1158 /DNA_ORIENTATION=+
MIITDVGSSSSRRKKRRPILSTLLAVAQFLALCLSLLVVSYSNLALFQSAATTTSVQSDAAVSAPTSVEALPPTPTPKIHHNADPKDSPKIPHNIITTPTPKIPHNILFTYKHNIVQTKEPKLFYDNVVNTRDAYLFAWDNDPSARVYFLDDDECRKFIEQAEPKLLDHFNKEKQGMYKADICRIAALKMLGGYYLDVDLKVIEPVLLNDEISFATVKEAIKAASCKGGCPKDPAILAAINAEVIKAHEGNMFQAFLAAEPGHSILKAALHFMLLHYEGKKDAHGLMGVSTLADAFKSISPEERGQHWLLQEYNNVDEQDSEYYPDYHQNGRGCCCDYLVHDPEERKVYFFSRIVGSSEDKCALP